MGFYIKITGRGYLKDVNTKYGCEYGKFSKQLTLAYCADSEAEAEAHRNKVLSALKKKRDEAKKEYEAALKIITFPEMFGSAISIKTFLKKQGITLKTSGWGYNGFEKLVNDANKDNVLNAIGVFKDHYYGYPEFKREYNSLKTACRLIENGKIVELENIGIKVNTKKKKVVKFRNSVAKDNEKESWQIYCSCCGANIPGAKYLVVDYSPICPYCLQNYQNDINAEINRLGPEVAKNYKKKLFVECL